MRAPAPLQALPQWVGYRAVWVPERGKFTKKPVRPADGGPGSSTDSTTWATFHEALEATKRLGLDGVGFVLTESDPFTVIDLDVCRNPETGEIEPWAWEIVQRLDTFTEISPSGTGLHIVASGRLPVSGRRKGPIEVYYSGRYVTVTGKALEGHTEIRERTDELVGWFAETFPSPGPQDAVHRPTAVLSLDDEAVLQLATNAANGPDTMALYAGDTSRHGGDHSAADLALLSRLAFYTQDPDQLDRLFRTSGLYREKWERTDYRERTIARALEGLRETYNPARPYPSCEPQDAVCSSETPEVAALQARLAEMEAALAAEKARADRAEEVALRAVRLEQVLAEREEQLRQCSERNEAMRKVLANPTMDPADKVIGLATLQHMNAREGSDRHTDPEKGTRVNYEVVARLSGMSRDTVGKRVKKLAEGGVFERRESSFRDPEGGPPITNVWLKADGTLIDRTNTLAETELKRTHGGVRVKKVCDVCGSDDIHHKSHKECHGCGHQWDRNSTPINPPELEIQPCEPQDAALSITTIPVPQDAVHSPEPVPLVQQQRLYVIPPPGDGVDEFDPHSGYGGMYASHQERRREG